MQIELLRRGERVAGRYEAIAACYKTALWIGYSCLSVLDPPRAGRGYDTTAPGVLLKVVRPELLREPGACERLVRELQQLQALKHEGLPRLVDVVLLARLQTVVLIDSCTEEPSWMHHVPRTVQGRALFTLQDVLKTAAELAAVLGYLHDHGMCHGDLRSETVLPGMPAARTRLRDLGLARSLSRAAYLYALDRTDDTAWIAPEVRAGQDPDRRADVYAMAALIQDLLHTLYEDPAVLPRKHPGLEGVLERGLHADPAQRYESAAALLTALSRGTAP